MQNKEIKCLCNVGNRELRFPQLKEGEVASLPKDVADAMIEAGLAVATEQPEQPAPRAAAPHSKPKASEEKG